jgi:CTP:molybdopterin cytidylyltransferase MocA
LATKLKENTSAIILAAGKSERMGIPKFMLRHADGQTFLQKLVSEFLFFGCRQVVAVLNANGCLNLFHQTINLPVEMRLVENSHPEWGRLYSLKLAVDRATPAEHLFISNIDNPFMNVELLESLYQYAEQADYIMPEYQGRGGHPILISRKVAEDIRALTSYSGHLKEFLMRYSNVRVEVNNHLVLANINTMDDYQKYFGDLAHGDHPAPSK